MDTDPTANRGADYWTKIRDDNERKHLQDLDERVDAKIRMLNLLLEIPPGMYYNESGEYRCMVKNLDPSEHALPVGAPVVSRMTNLCRQLREFVRLNSHHPTLRYALKPVKDSVWRPLPPHKFSTAAAEFVPEASEHRLETT